jgi:hypothetical protein
MHFWQNSKSFYAVLYISPKNEWLDIMAVAAEAPNHSPEPSAVNAASSATRSAQQVGGGSRQGRWVTSCAVMIRAYLEKRKVRKAVGRLVRPETVDALLRNDGIGRQPFTAARIEFILVFVAGKTPEEVSERVGRVTEIVMSHDGSVHDIIGALVVVAFGTSQHSSPVAGKRAALVEHLNRELSSHLKIVHGAADGHYGLVGGGVRISYSFVLPRFDAMLGRLSQLEFGQIDEFVT